jgi:tRNA G18 (ribose-2'-O)-methylase SpoU
MSTFFECVRPECRFRFTTGAGNYEFSEKCPKCGANTRRVDVPDYQYHRTSSSGDFPGPRLEILLDNLRSTFNVGSIFRTADGAGVDQIHLLGITPPVSHPQIHKTALGAELTVPSAQHWNGVDAAREVKARGLALWALEDGDGAQSIFTLADQPAPVSIALVVGNEAAGVDPEILSLCDQIVSIPMMGKKESLNVAIACSVAVYVIRCLMRKPGGVE